MKSPKSTKSLRSIRSARSGKSENIIHDDVGDLDNMLVIACAKFNCPYAVSVKKEIRQDDYYKALKQADTKVKSKRISLMPEHRVPESTVDVPANSDQAASVAPSVSYTNNITTTFIYDNYNTLTEIKITKVSQVPVILLKIIGLLVPYYKNLVRLSITNCGIDMYTIHELGKMVNVSTITEICLDGSPLASDDYSMLLRSSLRYLSLCRCKVNDEACEIIASKLHHAAAADNLLLLNLSSNHITDEGVKYFGCALRTNRHLRYLNLADNHINDDGASYLFDVLIEFPLTSDEILNMRQKRLDYFKYRNTLYKKYLDKYCKGSFDQISQSTSSKRKKTSTTTLKSKSSARKEKERPSSVIEEFVKTKAEMMLAEILGPLQYPFLPHSIKKIDGYIYSFGNMTLASLNLAYNNLSYISIKKLYKVILYQNSVRNITQGGLVKVVVDGNNLPTSCMEMADINELMTKMIGQLSKNVDLLPRRSRAMK
ncbi:leucine-rich repeat-containing protein 71-like [Vanessa cardui]|uniref:leucine-rich repeat-containing protein 71-like n=1 Tax=Vanessa cardui TaxID=171605 RepID=UPI001F13FC91|nr:leucine-rich repeat-containing protein 71-like [Vanessa cardui]